MKFFPLLILLPLLACENPSQVAPVSLPTTNPVQIPGGVIDSSGGELIRSTTAEVKEALSYLPLRLEIATFRLNQLIRPERIFYEPVLFSDRKNWKALTYKPLQSEDLLESKRSIAEMIHRIFFKGFNEWPGLSESLEQRLFKWVYLEDSHCHAVNGARDASATSDGEICMSIPQLQKLDPRSLSTASIALAFHEIAHVYGYGEDEAELFQRYIHQNASFYVRSTEQKQVMLVNASLLRDHYLSLDRQCDKINDRDLDLEDAIQEADLVQLSYELGNLNTSIRQIYRYRDWGLAEGSASRLFVGAAPMQASYELQTLAKIFTDLRSEEARADLEKREVLEQKKLKSIERLSGLIAESIGESKRIEANIFNFLAGRKLSEEELSGIPFYYGDRITKESPPFQLFRMDGE